MLMCFLIRICFCKMKLILSIIVGWLVEIMVMKVSFFNICSFFGGKNVEKRLCFFKLISFLRRICFFLMMMMMMVCYFLDFWMVGLILMKGNFFKICSFFGRMNIEKKLCFFKLISFLKKICNFLFKIICCIMVFWIVGFLLVKVSFF